MKVGDIFEAFGCEWMVYDVYEVPASEMMSKANPFGMWHKKRYKAHVVKAPEGYKGVREMDVAFREED